jgi:hypothetical protein
MIYSFFFEGSGGGEPLLRILLASEKKRKGENLVLLQSIKRREKESTIPMLATDLANSG